MQDGTNYSVDPDAVKLLPATSEQVLPETPSRAQYVGNTKAQQLSFSPDLPIAAITLLLTALNLTSPLTRLGFLFALAAFIVSSVNVVILSRQPMRVSRPATIVLLTLACLSLLVSRTVALGSQARVHVSLSQEISARSHVSKAAVKLPIKLVRIGPHGVAGKDENDLPVSALEAVERSQQASPNAGDVATEAHENSLDETRVSREEDNLLNGIEKASRPRSLDDTFIINTHTAESCSAACTRYNYGCAQNAFRVVNSCKWLKLRLSCSECLELSRNDSLASSLPGSVDITEENKSKCFTLKTSDIELAQCHMSAQNMKRLCPCVV